MVQLKQLVITQFFTMTRFQFAVIAAQCKSFAEIPLNMPLAGIVHLAQRQQYLRRVVGIGIELIVVLEVPPTRFRLRYLHRPIALVAHFL